MRQDPQFVENILKEAALGIVLPNYSVQFDAGSELDIINQLSLKDESNSNLRNLKYPLIAAKLPILHKVGTGLERVRIPRIIIAHLSTREFTPVMERFASNEVFKTVLQPVYIKFLQQLAKSKWTSISDPDAIEHSWFFSAGQQKVAEGLNDYVDIIEILNMEFYLNNLQNCK